MRAKGWLSGERRKKRSSRPYVTLPGCKPTRDGTPPPSGILSGRSTRVPSIAGKDVRPIFADDAERIVVVTLYVYFNQRVEP